MNLVGTGEESSQGGRGGGGRGKIECCDLRGSIKEYTQGHVMTKFGHLDQLEPDGKIYLTSLFEQLKMRN